MRKVFLITLLLGMQTIRSQEVTPFKPTIKFNGRIHFDYEFITDYNDNTTEKEYLNANEFRRLYFSVSGFVTEKLKYKIETNFANGSIHFADVYLKYNFDKLGNIYLGAVTEATGLNTMTSSKYITFVERSMSTAFHDYRWGSGVHYENFGLLDGRVTLQMAFTNPNGLSDSGFKDIALDDGMIFTSRVTTTLINDKAAQTVVHLGVNYDSRNGKTIAFRPENHMGTYKYNLGFTSDKRSTVGFELASTFGSLSIQGEYKAHNGTVDADNKTYKVGTYYAFASYFLTGEHRSYKKGTFGSVKPKHDVDNGGMGALEVALRYSVVDNSDYMTIGNYDKVNNLTFGLNWYLNAHARVMYNYVATDYNGLNGEKAAAHLFRVQMDF